MVPQISFMMKRARFVIVILPNLEFWVVLALSLLLTLTFDLPWRFFPGMDMMSLWRLVELVAGQVLMVLAVMFLVWGSVTIGLEQTLGKEVGGASDTSTLATTGVYAYCRHPITLGFVLAMPAFALTFDFVPLLLVALLFTPLLLAHLVYEERELLRRFGNAYVLYRQTVPFLIPWGKRITAA